MYGKIFDNVVLNSFSDKLMSSELQFGFNAHSSTDMCSMVLKDSIVYYNTHQSSVFCTFLDLLVLAFILAFVKPAPRGPGFEPRENPETRGVKNQPGFGYPRPSRLLKTMSGRILNSVEHRL